ncbi:MAG: cytochrome [Solirubrobacterales bacterium]|nr:cytochrome [Solirubrobacterales bacterium]
MSTIEQPAGAAPGIPTVTDYDPFDHYGRAFFRRARKETPVFYDERLGAYVITRYADCNAVLKDKSGAVSAQTALAPNVQPIDQAMQILGESGFVPAPSLVDEDAEVHRIHREATQGPFKMSRIKGLEGFIRRQVDDRLDAIVKSGAVDIVDAMIYEVPATVILHMMGLPDEQMGMVKDFRGPWAVFQWGFPSEEVQIHTAHGMGAFGQWARALSQSRIDQPGEDIISEAHQNLEAAGAMDRPFLDSYTLNVVMAGHETTTNTMAGGLKSLLEHPDQYAALAADPSLIPNAADEILRYDTGVPTWRQFVVEDFPLPSGATIPAGSKVYVALNSANRDEEVFEDGDRFDVRRTNASKHLAFGTGVHTCMGNHLAKMELRIMLEALTQRLPHAELVPGQQWVTSPNTSQRGPEHLQITWDPAQNPRPEDRP